MPDALQRSAAPPRVTLVMTVRERHRLTLAAIESILAGTALPVRFLFAHGGLPGWLAAALAPLEQSGRLELREFPGKHWPQELRQAVIGEVDTEYVVFIDNDVQVSKGWLERLVECADETRAGSVGPLYLWGDGASPPRVHMAGGMLHELPDPRGRVLMEEHRHIDADPARVFATLKRGRCDYLEFHCMLVRTELAQGAGVLDASIVCVHEHIHVALALREQGHATYLEPASQVTYLAFVPHVLGDLELLRSRWNAAATEASIAAFCRRWNVLPDDRSFGGVRGYVRDLRARDDPLRVVAPVGDRGQALARGQVPQTRAQLLELAAARGYDAAALALLSRACHVAAALTDGGYRPCGRPFVQHLIGTAGVLLRYDFRPEIVLEGLLHAAYTHRRLPAVAVQGMLAGVNPKVEARVREYAARGTHKRPPTAAACLIRDVEIAAIEAANEIDMRLSGEYDYSGRPAEIGAEQARFLGEVLELVGAAGMAATLAAALHDKRNVPRELVTGINVSYRLGVGNTLIPMAPGVPAAVK